jgi:polar amino acid transport system permease protein
MVEFSLWDILRNLLLAARWTILLSLIAFAGGALVGSLLLLARLTKQLSLEWFCTIYVKLFQGTPLLMQLFLIYFGMALLGIETTPWSAAVIALTLYSSAFLSEIWRGCIESIPKGQWQAADSLALGFFDQIRYVIGPQAIKISIAPTVGFMVQAVKATALASVIGFIELTKAGTMISNATFKPFVVFACVGALYFSLCYPISWYSKRLELKYSVKH